MTRLSIGGKSRKRGEPFPGPLPGRRRLGVLDPQIGLREVGQGLPGGLLARGGVDGFDSGGDLLAVPVGHEPHPGARNRVVPAQVGTVAWGQDCLRSPRAGPSARRIPPRASLPCGRCPLYDQTRPDAAVVPARAHTSRPSRRLLPRPGAQILKPRA